MSQEPVQPMSGHFLWSDFTETHIPNLFTGFANVPRNKLLLILIARYIDPVTNEEILDNGAKIGHWIGGWDNYYFNSFGNPPTRVQYATWNDPYTNNTRTTVYELRGFGIEESIPNVRVGTFANTKIWKGGLVSDTQWEQAMLWAENY